MPSTFTQAAATGGLSAELCSPAILSVVDFQKSWTRALLQSLIAKSLSPRPSPNLKVVSDLEIRNLVELLLYSMVEEAWEKATCVMNNNVNKIIGMSYSKLLKIQGLPGQAFDQRPGLYMGLKIAQVMVRHFRYFSVFSRQPKFYQI